MPSYALTGPPFNFTGHFSESQKNSFSSWVSARSGNFPAIQLSHQIRAQQLRKTAGLLEKFYATANTDPLTPSFQKQAWQPGANGHWAYAYRNDQAPAAVMTRIKERFRHQLETQDDGVFHMNHLRTQIEKQEDQAQYAFEAPAAVTALMNEIEVMFGMPEYQAVLVRDIADPYKGGARFRVHQLDPPTQWEMEQNNHGNSSSPLSLKIG